MTESTKSAAPVCLITGGSSGIGLATAKRFAGQGYQIATCGRSSERLDTARSTIESAFVSSGSAEGGSEVFAREVDLNDPAASGQFAGEVIAEFGRVDVIVNNAGLAPLAPFSELSDETFENVLNVNMRSVFQITQTCWKQMLLQKSGAVVNVSSLAAVDPFPGFSIYGASKAWIDLLTVALASEGSEHNIRACSVRPGAVETPLLRGLFPDFPAEQCVSPEDVAETIWACIADPEKYQSGKAFEVTNQNQ